MIASFYSHLPPEEQRAASNIALQAADAISDRHYRYELLEGLIPVLPTEQLDDAAALIPDSEEQHVLGRENVLVALALRRAECGQLAEAITAASRCSYAYAICRAYTRISTHFPPSEAAALLDRAETSADKSRGTRIELLAEIARHRAEPHRSRLIYKALALARGIDKGFVSSAEEEKARAFSYIASLVDGERRSAVIMEAWQHAPKSGASSGIGVLESLAPFIAELEPRQTALRWRADLERASRERGLVLDELRGLAPLVARLGGENGAFAVIKAVYQIAKWWP